jgi:hypothetical protein
MLGRDRRLLAIFALCTGAGVAECLLFSRAGLRGGVAIAAGFKFVQAVSRRCWAAWETCETDHCSRQLLWLVPKGEEPTPIKA